MSGQFCTLAMFNLMIIILIWWSLFWYDHNYLISFDSKYIYAVILFRYDAHYLMPFQMNTSGLFPQHLRGNNILCWGWSLVREWFMEGKTLSVSAEDDLFRKQIAIIIIIGGYEYHLIWISKSVSVIFPAPDKIWYSK